MSATRHRMRVAQVVRGTRGRVFQAFSDPKLARRWGPDGCRVVSFTADMRVGGTFREVMSCDGERHTAHGVYRKIVPEKQVVFTHQWEEEDPVETLVTVGFRDKGRQTEIVLTQTGFRDAAAAKGHAEGWSSALATFARVFAAKGRGRAPAGTRPGRRARRARPAATGRRLSGPARRGTPRRSP
jgi:uncharacterized protein YndB with AHSA1/START domain